MRVRHLDHSRFEQGPLRNGAASRSELRSLGNIGEFLAESVHAGANELVADLPRQRRPVRFAQLGGGLDQNIQDLLQIEGRAADHLQYVGGRGLLMQRLGQLAGTRLHLVEQPHVVDRDHRLLGECLQQRDLLVAERPPLHPGDDDRSDRLVLAQHRHGKLAAEPGRDDRIHAVLGILRDILDVDHRLGED